MSNAFCGKEDPHPAHEWGNLNWCLGWAGDPEPSEPVQDEGLLLARLRSAETSNMHARPCQVCDALGRMSDRARAGVEAALAGTIGERTLAQILTDSGYTTGRRAVQNHRREGHTP